MRRGHPCPSSGAPPVTDTLGRGRAPTVWHVCPGPGAWQCPGLIAPDSSWPAYFSCFHRHYPEATCFLPDDCKDSQTDLSLTVFPPSFQLNLEKSSQNTTLFITHTFSLSYKRSGLLKGPNSSAQQPRLCAHTCMHVSVFPCLCMWIRVGVCICTCRSVCMFICVWNCVCVRESVCICVCTYMCVKLFMWMRAHEYVYVCVKLCVCDCVCICVYLYLCMCMCVRVHICMCMSVCMFTSVYVSACRLMSVCRCLCMWGGSNHRGQRSCLLSVSPLWSLTRGFSFLPGAHQFSWDVSQGKPKVSPVPRHLSFQHRFWWSKSDAMLTQQTLYWLDISPISTKTLYPLTGTYCPQTHTPAQPQLPT